MVSLKKIKSIYSDVAVLVLLSITLPLFFFNLGQSSLVSWDEAWYAEISRNIIHTGSILNLSWNGEAYYDHPPVGFWLIAISELVFGQSEFGVRAASAIIGFLSLVVMYFLGKVMFGRVVGFCSAIALSSSFWFLFRARSGNLDVFLTFFFLLTFYTAWKAKDNARYLPLFALSLVLLFLTKTGTPVTVIPALVIIFWGARYKLKDFIVPLIVFAAPLYLWFNAQVETNKLFVDRYLQIGLPGVKAQTSYLENFNLTKTYIHDGIGKWFWLGILGVLLGPLFRKRQYWVFPIFFISFVAPFVFSPKGQIWHLIPTHPALIISFFSFAYALGMALTGIPIIYKIKGMKMYRTFLVGFSLVVFCFYLFSIQANAAWAQFINTTTYRSDEEILSKEAGKHQGEFLIDADFGPTAVWYSGKEVKQIRNDDIKRLFNREGSFSEITNFLLITKQYRLDEMGIAKSEYKILKSDRDKILVSSK